MKYIGNYNHWIKDEWINYITNNDGANIPRDYPSEERNSEGALKPFSNTGWSPTCVCCITYDKNNLPFKIELPTKFDDYDFDGCESEWWFVKFPCGMGQPIHQDYDKNPEAVELKRLWMPLQDYELGHIFIYEDTLITGYKKGDVYMYDDKDAWHTAGNLGYHLRISINFSFWR